jgi:hypothetical protein
MYSYLLTGCWRHTAYRTHTIQSPLVPVDAAWRCGQWFDENWQYRQIKNHNTLESRLNTFNRSWLGWRMKYRLVDADIFLLQLITILFNYHVRLSAFRDNINKQIALREHMRRIKLIKYPMYIAIPENNYVRRLIILSSALVISRI